VEKTDSVLGQAMNDRLCLLAHELNNALSVIAGNCELLAERAEPGSEGERRLRKIVTLVHTLARRINGHECRMAFAPALSTIDLDTLPLPFKDSGKPSQSTEPRTSDSAKAG
jgi:nitrogen-specific signal transduction histidine kinase